MEAVKVGWRTAIAIVNAMEKSKSKQNKLTFSDATYLDCDAEQLRWIQIFGRKILPLSSGMKRVW
jgi:hypothetical protein